MLALAFDSSTDQISAALLDWTSGEVRAEKTVAAARYSEVMIPLIEEMLTQVGAGVKDLRGVAAGVGPGSFAGLRIGITTAKTLAQALRIPLVGIPALDALEAAANRAGGNNPSSGGARIVAALDARRGEIYRRNNSGAAALVSIPDFTGELETAATDLLLIGTAADLYENRSAGLERARQTITIAKEELRRPSADQVGTLALPLLHVSDWRSLFQVSPLYWRSADALTLKERQAAASAKAASDPKAG